MPFQCAIPDSCQNRTNTAIRFVKMGLKHSNLQRRRKDEVPSLSRQRAWRLDGRSWTGLSDHKYPDAGRWALEQGGPAPRLADTWLCQCLSSHHTRTV